MIMNKIYVVGMGPGKEEGMTRQAYEALEESEIIIGYPVYLELLPKAFSSKEKLGTPMKKEVERCRICIEKALEGRIVSMVCSGDAGVYGMASLILELLEGRDDVEVCIVPGVTAALSGAAVLGAPLSHDFCVISLSDLLTPYELIMDRVRYAAKAGFVMAIYNPSSRKRSDYLKNACDILLEELSGDTVCGYVENIGREGEKAVVCTLRELRDTSVNMFTTVFVGNKTTRNIAGRMVTKRGYDV